MKPDSFGSCEISQGDTSTKLVHRPESTHAFGTTAAGRPAHERTPGAGLEIRLIDTSLRSVETTRVAGTQAAAGELQRLAGKAVPPLLGR
ncbi:hypothetical protein [Amycolatopsis sp. NPDC098790]|uniref:hypothetical protein n=1 Tax=Amycolatopsis sp. NPDC098790 TaxID=3363939 RepID=UPI00381F1FDD